MRLRAFFRRIIPYFVRTRISLIRETRRLHTIVAPEVTYDYSVLKRSRDIDLEAVFASVGFAEAFRTCENSLRALKIPDDSGGVNRGDRQAVYFLVRAFKPYSVLEVGTHIGASTALIASALRENAVSEGEAGTLDTVDIVDVNSETTRPWLRFGASFSPAEMLKKLSCDSIVRFNTDDSLSFLNLTNRKFDFVFLDGDHSAKTVYQEIPLAISHLKPGGVLLMHDFFPNGMALWSDGSVIPGPFLALERIMREVHGLRVMPLGDLPWPTKLNSRRTSLALLSRDY